MALRRGFKSEANSIARDMRTELGLRSAAALDPWMLAQHLGIDVLRLSHFQAETPTAAQRFLQIEKGAFSALTVFDGHKRIIVINDAHSGWRQASDLAHELAHALLLHEPGPAFHDDGIRNWNEDMEDEAEWLAGALLISEEAALTIVREGLSVRDAARKYGVTPRMVQFRMNVTAARVRVERAEKYRLNGKSAPTK
jgi:Zn-dependent peptidase ImmA (M78 family)